MSHNTESPTTAVPDELQGVVAVKRKDRGQAPVALILGLLMLALSAFFLRNDGPLLLTGTRTQGQLLDYQQAPSQSGRYSLHAWVRFRDDANQEHQFLDAVSTTGRLLPLGGPIGIIYDSAQPRRAIVDRGLWKESVLAVPGALGAFLLVRAFSLRRRMRDRPA